MRNTRSLVILIVMGAAAIAFFFGSDLLAQEPDTTAEPVYKVGNGVTAPKTLYAPKPTYDDNARKKKINGTVVLAMIVTAEGTVRDVRVLKSLDPGLDKRAIAAVRAWRFEPATKDGKPVAVHLKTEADFRLY